MLTKMFKYKNNYSKNLITDIFKKFDTLLIILAKFAFVLRVRIYLYIRLKIALCNTKTQHFKYKHLNFSSVTHLFLNTLNIAKINVKLLCLF
jgi:hypothetical protein